ncbi:hypothetical protein K440DRAFT_609160 [Wilcoxina mikolae CBS 423.85]|nr:hypothetical protein K440DRAFT_609160 [Wilcoxina mikolae CBS 423.85]
MMDNKCCEQEILRMINRYRASEAWMITGAVIVENHHQKEETTNDRNSRAEATVNPSSIRGMPIPSGGFSVSAQHNQHTDSTISAKSMGKRAVAVQYCHVIKQSFLSVNILGSRPLEDRGLSRLQRGEAGFAGDDGGSSDEEDQEELKLEDFIQDPIAGGVYFEVGL